MARDQPSERDRKANEKLQEKVLDFPVMFNEPYDIHLEPPSHDHPPLVKIKQKGKPSVYTMDFYFTNKLPSNIAVQPQGTNNNSPNAYQAEAADPTFFKADPLQPGKVCLHLWMLHTPQAPMLDLTGEHIKTKEDIKEAFHALNLCTHNEQKSDGTKENKAKQSKVSIYQTVILTIMR